jgi:hypothetical protein
VLSVSTGWLCGMARSSMITLRVHNQSDRSYELSNRWSWSRVSISAALPCASEISICGVAPGKDEHSRIAKHNRSVSRIRTSDSEYAAALPNVDGASRLWLGIACARRPGTTRLKAVNYASGAAWAISELTPVNFSKFLLKRRARSRAALS